jgi:hypothetical protein
MTNATPDPTSVINQQKSNGSSAALGPPAARQAAYGTAKSKAGTGDLSE